MNSEKLNRWLALLANIGVIAGIVFLAVEIQQNTNMTRAQTRDAMTGKLMNWYTSINSSEFTASTFAKGSSDPNNLDRTSGELIAFNLMIHSNLHMWENELYQYQMGLFDEDEFATRLLMWKHLLKTNFGVRSVWQSAFTEQFSPDFKELIDGFISENQAEEASGN